MPSIPPIKIDSTAAPTPPSVFEKAMSEMLTPDMSDIEKLQKLKEWILADQHPFFTSAPKVAHLLSLRVSGSGSSTSEDDPLSVFAGNYNTIPLAERLSSPRVHANGDSNGFHDSASNLVSSQDDPSFEPQTQGTDNAMDTTFSRREEDVNLSETRGFEPNEHGSNREPYSEATPQSYQRHPDVQRSGERQGFDENGRRSPPRDDSRGWPKWDDGRGPVGDHRPRFPPGNDGRYENTRGRYGASYYRGGYNNQGNRRFSLNDRSNSDQRYYDNARNYERRPDFNSSYPDERRVDDRYGDKGPASGPRGQVYYGRRADEQKIPTSPQDHSQPLKSASIDANNLDEEMQLGTKEVSDSGANATDGPSAIDSKTEPMVESPVSVGNGLPSSTTDSAVPPTASSDRTDVQMDVQSLKGPEDADKPGTDHSPTPNVDNRETRPQDGDRDSRSTYMPRDGNRFSSYDNRPRMNTYQKYPAGNRNYDRPYGNRETYHRLAYRAPSPPPPADDRRFVPRDVGYAPESGYVSPPRRDYRPGEWDAKRDDRPLDRPYDRNRDLDRDRRVPAALPPNDPRGPKLSGVGPPRPRYPPPLEHAAPRGAPARIMHDQYSMPPSHDPRAYERDPYAEPVPPVPGAYSRDPSRVRPRSLSPPRREYRTDDRPPNKRLRGPDAPYGPPPVAGKSRFVSHGLYSHFLFSRWSLCSKLCDWPDA